MSQISLRVDRNLKEAAYDQLKNLGVTPSDFFRDMLEYVVRENKLPIRRELISDEDADLLAMVKLRLKQPEKLKKVSFDELLQ